jgi:hypothetical protein
LGRKRNKSREGLNEVETALVVQAARRGGPGRPKNGSIPAEVCKEDRAQLALTVGAATLEQAGYKSNDPEYRHLLLVRLVEQGVSPSVAAIQAGFESKAQGMKIMAKARNNPRFKKKLDDLHAVMRQSYIDSKVATLPQLSGIEAAALKEYEADPTLAIHKPKLLRDLMIVAGVQAPNGAVIDNSVTNIQLENLQAFIQNVIEAPDDQEEAGQ